MICIFDASGFPSAALDIDGQGQQGTRWEDSGVVLRENPSTKAPINTPHNPHKQQRKRTTKTKTENARHEQQQEMLEVPRMAAEDQFLEESVVEAFSPDPHLRPLPCAAGSTGCTRSEQRHPEHQRRPNVEEHSAVVPSLCERHVQIRRPMQISA